MASGEVKKGWYMASRPISIFERLKDCQSCSMLHERNFINVDIQFLNAYVAQDIIEQYLSFSLSAGAGSVK